jgi:tetratricopeptide (TPR) repeat protein
VSFIDSIKKNAKLKEAIKLSSDARKAEPATAEQMFKKSYQDYAEVVSGDLMRAEALYNWGFALLHQAKVKPEVEAIKIYQDAIAKFAFCILMQPSYLGAAIDGGVACMDLARIKAVPLHDELYQTAKAYFEKANAIQAGSASYNLACICALQGEHDACLQALEEAKNKGSLPEAGDIIADPDMVKVNNAVWFLEFIDALTPKTPEPVVAEKTEAAEEIESPKAEAVESESATDVQDESPAKDDDSENQSPVRE